MAGDDVIGDMSIVLGMPGVDGLSEAVRELGEWQREGAPVQLHPGDVDWFWRFGATKAATAMRTWSRDEQILALGLLDGATLMRLAIAPDAQRDEELGRRLVNDLGRDDSILIGAKVCVEAPVGTIVRGLLAEDGWTPDESWDAAMP